MKKETGPLRPFQYAIKHMIVSILDGTYTQGSALPSERDLAAEIGITRPTLREAFQLLASEGWLTIRHGKATVVNHYLQDGNLALINRLAEYPDLIPREIIDHLLEVRVAILPHAAEGAYVLGFDTIHEHLSHLPNLEADPVIWADFDWTLQIEILRAANNPLFNMIFKNFGAMFALLGAGYFSNVATRKRSLGFYNALKACRNSTDCRNEFHKAMVEARDIWNRHHEEDWT